MQLKQNRIQYLLQTIAGITFLYLQYKNWDRPDEEIAHLHYTMTYGWLMIIFFGILGLIQHIQSMRLEKLIEIHFLRTTAHPPSAQLNMLFALLKPSTAQYLYIISAIACLLYGLYTLSTTPDNWKTYLRSSANMMLCIICIVGIFFFERIHRCSRLEKLLQKLDPLPADHATNLQSSQNNQ